MAARKKAKKTAKKKTTRTVAKKTTRKKRPARKVRVKKVAKKTTARKRKTKIKVTIRKKVTTRKKVAKKTSVRKKAAKKKLASKKTRRNIRYMGVKQTARFRQILLDWKKELMEEVDRTVHHMQDGASNFPDPNDRATQEEEFALELRTRDRERKLIAKIDESMGLLDAGEYGYCEDCGEKIGIKRLEARPTATLCINCKTLDEIRERHLT